MDQFASAVSGYNQAGMHGAIASQQAAMQQLNNAQALNMQIHTRDAPAPAPATIIEAAEQQARRHTRALEEVVSRLQAIRDRAFGADPQCADNSPAANSITQGAVHRMGESVAPHDGLVCRMHSLLSELDKVV